MKPFINTFTDKEQIRTIDTYRILYFLIAVISFLLTEAGRYVYRPFIYENHIKLNDVILELELAYQKSIRERQNTINFVNQMLLLFSVLVSFALLAWLYRKILRPLDVARKGFEQVAQGDFGYQVNIQQKNELADMADSFNHLSARLHAIFQLLAQLQQGNDLQQTIDFVGATFHGLIPLDWIGVFILNPSGNQLRLEVYNESRKNVPSPVKRINLDQPASVLIHTSKTIHILLPMATTSLPVAIK